MSVEPHRFGVVAGVIAAVHDADRRGEPVRDEVGTHVERDRPFVMGARQSTDGVAGLDDDDLDT